MLCHNDVLTCLGTGEQREARGARSPLSPARVQQQSTPPGPVAGAEPKKLSLRDLNPPPPAPKTGFLNAELSPRYPEACEIATFDTASSDGLCAKGSLTRLSRCNFRKR